MIVIFDKPKPASNKANMAAIIPNHSSSKQSGFTLVELLVGLALTVFIGTIAITYMWSSSQVFRVQTNDSLSQENARFALELLSQNIRLAGQNRPTDGSLNLDVVYQGEVCAGDDRSSANGNNSACTVDTLIDSADVLASDRFAVDYLADRNFTGCNGTNFNASSVLPQRLINVFWVADLDDDGIRSLYCQTINVTTGAGDVNNGAAQPLIDGVDAIQVQYGVSADEDTDRFRRIQRYQSYDNMIADGGVAATRRVRAIRIALLVSSGVGSEDGDGRGDILTEVAQDRNYQLLDETIDIDEEQVFRQVYSTTVAIPNTF